MDSSPKSKNNNWIITKQIDRVIAAYKTLINQIRNIPDDAFIVSNRAHILRIETERNVRTVFLSKYKSSDELQSAFDSIKNIAQNRTLYIFCQIMG